jgi:hypothetical protein
VKNGNGDLLAHSHILNRWKNMCLNETCSKVCIHKHLSYSLKQGDVISPLLFNFALEHVIRKVQENQLRLKLNGIHQLLAYTDDVNLLDIT